MGGEHGQGGSAREQEVERAIVHLRQAIDAMVKAELPLASAYADFALSICLRRKDEEKD